MSDFPSVNTPLPNPPRVHYREPSEEGVMRKPIIFGVLAVVAIGFILWLVVSGKRQDPPKAGDAPASVTVTATKPVACGEMKYKDCAKVPVTLASKWLDMRGGVAFKEPEKAFVVYEREAPVAVNVCDCGCEK